jgi:PKD repeat protein
VLAALIAVVLFCAFTAGTASAAPAWLPATPLGASDIDAETPVVAVAANGDAVAAWYGDPQSGQAGIQMATHAIGGAWVQTTPIAELAGAEQAAIDATGDATVMWQNGGSIDVASAPGDGAWSAPVQVNAGIGAPADAPAMNEDAAGDVTVVFDTALSGYPYNYQIWWTERPAGGAWSTPHILGGADGAPRSQISGDANGDVVVWWQDYTGGNYVLGAEVRPAGGSWQTSPQYVSSPASTIGDPDVVIGPGATAHAIWETALVPSALDSSDFTAGGADGGSWSAPALVNVAGTNASNPEIAFDAAGSETLLWGTVSGANDGIDAAIRPNGGSWSMPATLLALGDAASTSSSLSVSPSGQAVAGFAATGSSVPTTELSFRAAGGTWQPARELSPYSAGSSTPPSLGQDAAGNVLAAWEQNPQGATISSWAEIYDAGGPVMTHPSIPSTGAVGIPVTFAVTPLGAWSPVVSTQWSFGDGADALNQTVSHTYAQPGTYTVTASAGDSQGNSSTTSGTITISTPATSRPSSGPVGPASSATAPSLSRVSQSHPRWRDGKAVAKAARARRPRRPPVGTKLSFTVSSAAQVKFSFTQVLAGRLVKHRCVAPTSANHHARNCKRTKARGTLGYSLSAGAHHLSFDGRIGRRRLGAGSYTVAVSASNAAGHSAVKTLHFKIVG